MSSTLYTIGTALGRAKDGGHAVDVLVEGQWLTGRVMLLDGQGVVLDGRGHDHAVIRMDRIAAVRVSEQKPTGGYSSGSEAQGTVPDELGPLPQALQRGPAYRSA